MLLPPPPYSHAVSENRFGGLPPSLFRTVPPTATAYGLAEKSGGEINCGDLVALLQDAAAMEVAAAIVDLDIVPAEAEHCAAGCMQTLGLAEAKHEYQGMQGHLNEASEDAQREALKKYQETKGAKARVNPKAMPGR